VVEYPGFFSQRPADLEAALAAEFVIRQDQGLSGEKSIALSAGREDRGAGAAAAKVEEVKISVHIHGATDIEEIAYAHGAVTFLYRFSRRRLLRRPLVCRRHLFLCLKFARPAHTTTM
jgi:hypothetical protein